MSIYSKMYAAKKKRVRDPNLPPPPNLFSQAKELRETKFTIEQLTALVKYQHEEIRQLRSKTGSLELRLDQITNLINSMRKGR